MQLHPRFVESFIAFLRIAIVVLPPVFYPLAIVPTDGLRYLAYVIPTTHASLDIATGDGRSPGIGRMVTGDWICGHFCLYDWVCIAGSKKGGMAGEVKPKKEVPTPNSAPHDIVVDSSGIVWFTEINTNKIGRFDPKTEQFSEFDIPTPSSRPNGLVSDDNGNIWFTESGASKIGRVNPQTGEN